MVWRSCRPLPPPSAAVVADGAWGREGLGRTRRRPLCRLEDDTGVSCPQVKCVFMHHFFFWCQTIPFIVSGFNHLVEEESVHKLYNTQNSIT
jgi:hypothetical protein